MLINWENIKEKIISNTKSTFKSGNPSINDENITEGVNLLKKVILHNVGVLGLSGLPKALIPALQEAFITNVGNIGSLRVIADSLEPYLKKLSIIGNKLSISEIDGKTLIPILKKLEINTALTNQKKITDFPVLSETNLESFKLENEFLYQICNAMIIRNKVHVSPDLSELETLIYLKDLLVVYIYSTIKFKTEIDKLPNIDLNSDFSNQVLNGNENKMLFDFISFGNTTTEIKTQIIDAFILHYLLDKESTLISTIKDSADAYFDKVLTSHFYIRKVDKLKQQGKIEYIDSNKTLIKLTVTEKNRICKVQKDFADNKELFLLYFKDIIEDFKLSNYSDQILEKLTDFFVNNFDIDIKEIYDNQDNINEISILESLIDFLYTLTKNEETSKKLVVEILKLCEKSDFVIRISASKVLGKLTNPESFQNYVRNQKRIVYIDTQLVLYALCIGYVKNSRFDNIYFQIIEELISYSNEHKNIELRFSKLYLSEVANQLKTALLLIPFEEVTSINLSTNIFYLFYSNLKTKNLLKPDDNSFADFLENWLVVNEEDALHSECEQIISSNIAYLLESELNIKVITLPYYDNRDSAITILEETIRANSLTPKVHHILSNDALMVCHLSNSKEHTTEPFFLTWDKTFTYYRKSFKEKFNRMDIISWHLFNPSKFLNHMSLIDFRIEPKSITNEYLSILDSFGLHEKSRTIFDNMNRFLDIKNISKLQRRKYVEHTKKIFNEKEFSYEVNLPEEEVKDRISKPFESIIDDLNSYFHDPYSKYNIDLYRSMLLVEHFFVKVVDIIKNEIILEIKGDKRPDYKENINLVLKEYEDFIKTQLS